MKIEKNLVCKSHSVNEKTIGRLKDDISAEKNLNKLSKMFKALSDPTRLNIIYVLSKSELCVCDIANILEMTQSAISHQLKLLRDLKLLKYRRQGKLIIYSIDDNHVLKLFEQGLNHANHK